MFVIANLIVSYICIPTNATYSKLFLALINVLNPEPVEVLELILNALLERALFRVFQKVESQSKDREYTVVSSLMYFLRLRLYFFIVYLYTITWLYV